MSLLTDWTYAPAPESSAIAAIKDRYLPYIDGTFVELYSNSPVVAGQWYSFAAILSNDGNLDPNDQTLWLFLRDPVTTALADRPDVVDGDVVETVDRQKSIRDAGEGIQIPRSRPAKGCDRFAVRGSGFRHPQD